MTKLKKIKSFWENCKKNAVFPIVIAYLVLNLVGPQTAGTSEKSRIAMMQAMSDQTTFRITDYLWTEDWAQTPDGNYYSNKAPGFAFITFPLFYLVDHTVKLFTGKKIIIKATRGWIRTLLALVYQLIPFGLLILLLSNHFKESENVSNHVLYFFALATLFGNTASLYMINLMGHGMAAIIYIALCYSLIHEKYHYAGLSYGVLLLTEYGTLFIFPAVLLHLIIKHRLQLKKWLLPALTGAIIPILLWSWYHYEAFGSIFKMSAHYQNPAFLDTTAVKHNFLGMFTPLPKLETIVELLFGFKRSILVTQPWVLFLLIIAPIKIFKNEVTKRFNKEMILFIIYSFIAMLLMNSSFGGWHAGASSGPRYLAVVLPMFAVIGVMIYPTLSASQRKFLWILLVISLIFKWLTYVTTVMAPIDNIWPRLLATAIKGYEKTLLRSTVVAVTVILTVLSLKRRQLKSKTEAK